MSKKTNIRPTELPLVRRTAQEMSLAESSPLSTDMAVKLRLYELLDRLDELESQSSADKNYLINRIEEQLSTFNALIAALPPDTAIPLIVELHKRVPLVNEHEGSSFVAGRVQQVTKSLYLTALFHRARVSALFHASHNARQCFGGTAWVEGVVANG